MVASVIEIECESAGLFDVATDAARAVDALLTLRGAHVIVGIARDNYKLDDYDGVRCHLKNAHTASANADHFVDQSGLKDDDDNLGDCIARYESSISGRIEAVSVKADALLSSLIVMSASDPNAGFAYASLALLNRYRRNARFDVRVTSAGAGSTYMTPGQFAACAYIFAGMSDLLIDRSDDYLSFTATAEDAGGEIVADYEDPESLYFDILNEIACNNLQDGCC